MTWADLFDRASARSVTVTEIRERVATRRDEDG
jgi:hypothetical protein